MSALLPCPFCSGRAEIRVGTHAKYVICLLCGAMGPNLSSDPVLISDPELINAWNRRDFSSRGVVTDGMENDALSARVLGGEDVAYYLRYGCEGTGNAGSVGKILSRIVMRAALAAALGVRKEGE